MAARYGYDKGYPIMVIGKDEGIEIVEMTAGKWIEPIPPEVWRELVVAEYRDIYWREKHPDLKWGEFNKRFPLEAFPLP